MKTTSENDVHCHIGRFPLFGGNTMMEGSGGSGNSRGSFELYEDQRAKQRSMESNRRSPNLGQAPGCPGSLPESAQKVEELSQQVREMKAREHKLLQMLQQGQQDQMTFAPPMDGTMGMIPPASPSMLSDRQTDENVKEGLIKHLQRQVTMLQASAYKTDGWNARAQEAMNERDKAVDELRMKADQLNKAMEDNDRLRRELTSLNANYLDLQQKLRLTKQALDSDTRVERYQSQMNKMQEEINALRGHNQSLKESMSHLSNENKSLKDSSSVSVASSGSLGSNTACSQELEYLHSVVDTLKTTVLEQRNFLVSMKGPSHVNGQMSSHNLNGSHPAPITSRDQLTAMSKSASAVLDPEFQRMTIQGRTVSPSSGAIPRHPVENSSATLSSQGDSSRLPMRRASGMEVTGSSVKRTNYLDPAQDDRKSPRGFINSPAVTSTATSDLRHPQNPQTSAILNQLIPGVSSAASHLDHQNQSNISVAAQLSRVTNGSSPDPNSSSTTMLQKPSSNGSADITLQQVPMRKTSQSEVLARRPSSEMSGLNRNQGGSWSEVLARNPNKPGLLSPAGVQQLPTSTGRCAPSGIGAMGKSPMQGIVYEAAMLGPEDEGPLGPRPGVSSSTHSAAIGDPINQNGRLSGALTSTSSGQHIYHPPAPVIFADEAKSIRLINTDLMGGSRITTGTVSSGGYQIPQNSAGANNINNNGNNGQFPAWRDPYSKPQALGPTALANVRPTAVTTGPVFESELESPRTPNLNSDRICPVCNRDYSDVSMEDFQTHVFECFDDENAPETMRPQESLDRTCPMCNQKFSQEMNQQEFEAHVHSHFGEENFEMLQP